MSFTNPVYGIDKTGMGGGLASNPFGGAGLNVGGFGGSAPGYGGGGGFNTGQMGGLLSLANLGLGMMGQSNTAQSFNQMQQTGGLMRDLDFGTNLFAQNKDIFEQKDALRWAPNFKMNDPLSRQYETRQALMNPGIAGRYSAFVA
jgi:hypothetical protein